jgi:hypothetical protein
MKAVFQAIVTFIVIASLFVAFGGCLGSRESGDTTSSTPDAEDGSLNPIIVVPNQPVNVPEPNPGAFIKSGNLAAANTEVTNVKTAARAYSVDNQEASHFTSDDLVPFYLNTSPKARYYFSSSTGLINRVDSVPGGWNNIVFSLSQQKWIQSIPDNNHPNDQDVS